jgi:hypothetical protein
VKGHSIVAVKGDGDFHTGKDGLVAYNSAHVDYVESELIVRGPHSCQDMPTTIEEVRRILHEHLSSLAETELPNASAGTSPVTRPFANLKMMPLAPVPEQVGDVIRTGSPPLRF